MLRVVIAGGKYGSPQERSRVFCDRSREWIATACRRQGLLVRSQPGASSEFKHLGHLSRCSSRPRESKSMPTRAFVPVPLETRNARATEIRVEVRRADQTITVSWPSVGEKKRELHYRQSRIDQGTTPCGTTRRSARTATGCSLTTSSMWTFERRLRSGTGHPGTDSIRQVIGPTGRSRVRDSGHSANRFQVN
jgi:hypothetical protein